MAFSRKIKEDIFVASARHCSVCRSYKGLKVEVHHILPRAQGGKDIENNAISLCFDCHADAGHYFADHPKGSRVSPTELRKHKKEWEKQVLENNIPMPKRDSFHVKHVVTESFSMIKEISNMDLKNFPVKNSLLVENEVLFFLRDLIKDQSHRHGNAYSCYRFNSEKQYLSEIQDYNIIENNSPYNKFKYSRVPSKEEIKKVTSEDGIVQYLLENHTELEDISISLTADNQCEGIDFKENFLVRPMYFTLMVLENITDEPISINELIGNYWNDVLYTQIGKNKKVVTYSLPKMKVLPKHSIIIPTSIVLSEYDGFNLEDESTISRFNVGGEERQEFQKVKVLTNGNYFYIGPSYSFRNIDFENRDQEIHSLDLNSLYHIDRYFMCGSCPHLFFIKKSGKIEYARELFTKSPNEICSEEINLVDVDKIIVAELEKEVTYLKEIDIDGNLIKLDKTLKEGDFFVLDVTTAKKIRLTGKYSFLSKKVHELPDLKKEKIIRDFIKNYK